MSNISEYINSLKRTSKKAALPGTVLEELNEVCPICGTNAVVTTKPCCGERLGAKLCQACGFRQPISE